MLTSIIMITIPTFGIGLLPDTTNLLIAPLLLLLMRLLQGVLTGGEIPGMICFLTEGIPISKNHLISSMAFLGTQIGTILAIVECMILEQELSTGQFLKWGWRISFFIGGLIGLTGCLLRSKLKETAPFSLCATTNILAKDP